MTISGPNIPQGVASHARIGLHDVAPTLLELCDEDAIGAPDSRSFVTALKDERGSPGDSTGGFSEYHGGRYRLTQRVVWDGPWKLVWNGFDFDELYNLDDDPNEMSNLIDDHAYAETVQSLMRYAWERIKETGDKALWNSHYPVLRLAPFGPNILEDNPRLSGSAPKMRFPVSGGH